MEVRQRRRERWRWRRGRGENHVPTPLSHGEMHRNYGARARQSEMFRVWNKTEGERERGREVHLVSGSEGG